MSQGYYDSKWECAIGALLDTVKVENEPLRQAQERGIAIKKNDFEWFQYYGGLYMRYLRIYRELEQSYDQLVHPQRRQLAARMLDSTIVRLCEVKQNLIRYSTHSNIVQCDYLNLDEILLQFKLTPSALRVPMPRHFCEGSSQRDGVVAEVMHQVGVTPQIEVVGDGVTLDTNTETAVRIIQKLERGRQGIMRWLSLMKIKNKGGRDRAPDANNQEDTRTTVIQKYWRAFLDRQYVQTKKDQELRFLGIRKEPISHTLLQIADKQREHLKFLQKNHRQQFQADHDLLLQQIKKTQEPALKQKMLDQRRQWIKKFLEMHQFSNVPTKAKDFYKQKAEEEVKEQSKENKGGKKSEVDKFLEQHIAIGPTNAVVHLEENIKEYESTWASHTNSTQEIYDADLARNILRPTVQAELEQIVDSIINLELDGMRIKYGIKKKKQKKPRKKKNKNAKKIKIPQGIGKKPPRELLQELFEKGIAKLLNGAKMDEFLGEHNTVTHLIERTAETMPDPSLCQVRNMVTEYVGLPLGSKAARSQLQKWNWFLFYGAGGTGKTMMVRALQTETNAVLFDLTPEVVKERFTQKNQLTRLLWSVAICAQEFQPAIILVDDVETIFAAAKKKKEAGSNFGPKMKKVLIDLKKNKLWKKDDRITVLACTNKPYEGSLTQMKKMFDKKIYFPYPNYATRRLLIKSFLQAKVSSSLGDFPFETFAQTTEGFTAGSFKNTFDKVLTPQRIARFKDEPLRISELLNTMANSPCVFAQEDQKFKKFTDEVTGMRERREAKKIVLQDESKAPKKGK